MSEKDRFDWNDDMDFESDGEVQEGFDDFEDSLGGYDDFDDMSDYEDYSREKAPASKAEAPSDRTESHASEMIKENLAEKIPVDPKAAAALRKQKRRRGLSAMGLGFLFTASIFVAGVGMGGAILLAEGVHPSSLWRPQNLLQVDQLLNFTDHPLNVLYMVTMGIVFLALLGSFKMSRSAMQANERSQDAEDMLDRLTSLNMDKQEDWKSSEFAKYPPAEAFVIRTLGAWRLQEARHKRLMGVEGELHRLEKALSANSRPELTGRFDHPAVGRLADEMIRYFDARDAAVGKLEEHKNQDLEASQEFNDTLRESRQWNLATLDKLGLSCAALEKLTNQMKEQAQHVDKSLAEAGSTEGLIDIIEAIRRDMSSLAAGGMAADQMATELNDLVDRGSKLAFKIAMEVARLGPRGERLLPMSQSLEDLTTGFRQLTDRVNDQDVGGPAQAQKIIHQKLETLASLITQHGHGPENDLVEEAQDFGPAAARISSVLAELGKEFNQQEDRLVHLGKSNAILTGAEFDSHSIPRKESSEAPVAMLDFERQSVPNKTLEPADETAAPDPFSTSKSGILPQTESTNDPDFSSSVLPGQEPLVKPTEEYSSLELDNPGGFSLTPEPAADMPLSDDEEKVYDLGDLGASPVAEPDSEEAEQTFDLSAFGAIPVTDVDPQDPDQVHELSDFDASPMSAETSAPEEEVYDLSEFNASPLDQEAGPGPEEAEVEDDVFDLSAFGAKPMN